MQSAFARIGQHAQGGDVVVAEDGGGTRVEGVQQGGGLGPAFRGGVGLADEGRGEREARMGQGRFIAEAAVALRGVTAAVPNIGDAPVAQFE